MIPVDTLTHALEGALKDHRVNGYTTWQRVDEWVRAGRPPMPEHLTPQGGGFDGDARPDDRIKEAIEDAQAARYFAELDGLTERIHADLARLRRIEAICNPVRPRAFGTKDMLAAQVAADGFCVSCWRDEQELVDITKRPSGEPWYRDLCRPCGQYKAENGELPPLDVLRQRHGKKTPKKAG